MAKKLPVAFVVLMILISGCGNGPENPADAQGEGKKPERGDIKKYSLVNEKIPKIYYGKPLGYQPAPHGIAQAAREAFYAYERTGRRENLSRALFLADYLINSSVDRGSYIVWENPFPWPVYGLKRGWRGSLGQAGGLKVLMLAHRHTDEEKYRIASQKALNAFNVSLSEGGLLKRREGYHWYPEYAREEPPYVLNGFITTLIWIKEYADYSNSSRADTLYDNGLEALVEFLPSYDANRWSYYDSLGFRSNKKYHKLHVWQMGVMYNQTGREIFLKYYRRWGDAS